MKTTLDLPNDLLRAMKLRAVHEGRKYKDVAAEIFRRGLAARESSASRGVRQPVKLPLIKCRHPAAPANELTAEKVAELLTKQEVEWSHEASRR